MKRTIISFAVAALLGTSAYATCTITYNCGTGASGTKPATQSIDTDTRVFTPSSIGECTKDGYVFTHWQVSTTNSDESLYNGVSEAGTIYDVAWAGTEYSIPFKDADTSCASRYPSMTLTAQWVDASYTGIPTSKSYVDTRLNAKQPKLAALGDDKLMLYSNTTNGATLSRDIVTELGDSTSATTVPTRGAIVTGMNTKQNTLNGTAGWVMEGTGTAGTLKERPVYSTTNNYKTALVEAEDLNQMVIDAVNSELTQVTDGWRINSSVTLPALRNYIYLDPDIPGTGYCFSGLSDSRNSGCSSTVYSSLGNDSGKWGTVFDYGDIVGKSVCSATQGLALYATSPSQESSLNSTFSAQSGKGFSALSSNQKYCWCKMESVGGEPVVSRWVYYGSQSMAGDCADRCALSCATSARNQSLFRSAMFSTVQQ